MRRTHKAHHHNSLYYDGLLTNRSWKAGLIHGLLLLFVVSITEIAGSNEIASSGDKSGQTGVESNSGNEEAQCCNDMAFVT